MKNKLIEMLIFVIFLSLIFYPDIIHQELIDSLTVFFTTLFPSIFPFFLIGNLLISYHFIDTINLFFGKIITKLFHTGSNASFILIMSMLSGFPSGAKYIRDLFDRNLITLNQANYLITFTHFANPLFVLTTCSSLFYEKKIPYFILISMYLSNILIGILTRPKKRQEMESTLTISYQKISSFSEAFTSSLKNTLEILVMILGNTCFFYLVSKLVTTFIPVGPFFTSLVNGFFDLTKGITSLSFLNTTILLKGMLVLSFISFGGINIHMQVLNMIQNTKIKYLNFLLGRIAQASISALLFFILYYLFL